MDQRYRFRRYGAEGDLPGMVALRNARVLADGHGEETTLPVMAAQYANLQRCDPETDLIVVEFEGQVVGYARTMWDDCDEGTRDHWMVVEADRGHPGLDIELLEWVSGRAQERAAEMKSETDRPQQLITESVLGGAREKALVAHGFTPLRYGAMMCRTHLRDIPERPLPDGAEIRPVTEDQMRRIWEADAEAFRDHWGYVAPTEVDWEIFLADAESRGTSLWQIAWAGDEVVGQVRTYVNDGELELFGHRQAWTENISTSREWRKRGVAAALICASLRQLAELGFERAVLGVDTENPNGAFSLYESLGYEVVAMEAVFARSIDP